MKILRTGACLTAFLLASQVSAEGMYAGLGVASVSGTGSDTVSDGERDYTTTNAIILVGYEVNSNFAVEAEFSTTMSPDTIAIEGVDIDVDMEHFAVFGKYNLIPSTEQFSVYGRLGFAKGTMTASAGSVSISLDDEQVIYGVGAEYKYSANSSIRGDVTYADYTGTFDGVDASLEATTFSLTNVWRF